MAACRLGRGGSRRDRSGCRPGAGHRPSHRPPPDRFAVDQVAQRYRALGLDLLAGARRCAPVAPEPGERERVDCNFGDWSMVLIDHDTPGRLGEARTRAVAAPAGAVRSADAMQGDTAFVMHQERSGTSTVYWDTETPRPLSATISTGELSPAELLAFWDTRASTLLRRPEFPGAEFASATLWELAGPFVKASGATCAPTPVEHMFAEAAECRYSNEAVMEFTLLADPEQFGRYRNRFASEANTLPGTLRLGAWLLEGDSENRGQLAEYASAPGGDSYLYFDDSDALAFGLVFHPDLSQDELKAFWSSIASR